MFPEKKSPRQMSAEEIYIYIHIRKSRSGYIRAVPYGYIYKYNKRTEKAQADAAAVRRGAEET